MQRSVRVGTPSAHREVERRGWAEVELARGGRVITAERLYIKSEDVKTRYFEAAALGSGRRAPEEGIH